MKITSKKLSDKELKALQEKTPDLSDIPELSEEDIEKDSLLILSQRKLLLIILYINKGSAFII